MSSAAAPIVLASSSKSRAALLTNAGVIFTQIAPDVDENAVKQKLRAENASAMKCAEVLAEMKALKVSARHPEPYVIGGDQMLECGGRWFDKPADVKAARDQMLALRGKPHTLCNSLVVAKGGKRVWHYADAAKLVMRDFSPAFLETYMTAVGEAATWSVGGYQLEGLGAQLFERIDGDFFSILGLPLLPLLAFLREHGALKS